LNILGVNTGGHECAACLVQDGELIAAVEEERFSRIKHQMGFPKESILYCLEEGGIKINDVDYVASCWNPWIAIIPSAIHFATKLPKSINMIRRRSRTGYMPKFFVGQQIRKEIESKRKPIFNVVNVDHHLSHAASAFFISEFDEAAIFTLDAMGEWTTTLLAHGTDNKIKTIRTTPFPHSLGFMYSAFTEYLGFRADNGEGKVMGLASYGTPLYADLFKKIVSIDKPGKYSINMDYFDYGTHGNDRFHSKKFGEVFKEPRKKGEEITEHHENIAASLQQCLEESSLHLAHYLYEQTGSENLCLAGGVALNSRMNDRLLKETSFQNVFIQPASNDAGGALGAAFYVWNQVLQKPRGFLMRHAYWGPSYDKKIILNTLKQYELSFEKLDNPAQVGAKLIADGKILGWYQSRLEFGPRALGHRSIIVDPRKSEMKDILNARVKFRESFRPFAPSVLLEDADKYFDLRGHASPYMLLIPEVLKEKRKELPAITHVDGTARVQTVSKDQSPQYYGLISAFKKLTGCSVILNTSFNIRGEPIVCTPEDAVKCFLGTGIDALILGNYLSEKKQGM